MIRAALFLCLSSACQQQPPSDAGCSEPLFGRPVAQTGLASEQCRPSCACESFASRDWTAAQLAALSAWTLDAAFAEVTQDPYAAPTPSRPPGSCRMVVVDPSTHRYRLETGVDAGILTHHGACGVCSTLADLRVYAADPDLGAPVRQCGLDTFAAGFEANVTCLQNLGFTRPCAQIWAWNTANTRAKCLDPCVRFGGSNYHLSDGGLNECLACDETKSGPVFKAVAGRTRRNTGIASAICRPCSESAPVAHDYP